MSAIVLPDKRRSGSDRESEVRKWREQFSRTHFGCRRKGQRGVEHQHQGYKEAAKGKMLFVCFTCHGQQLRPARVYISRIFALVRNK